MISRVKNRIRDHGLCGLWPVQSARGTRSLDPRQPVWPMRYRLSGPRAVLHLDPGQPVEPIGPVYATN